MLALFFGTMVSNAPQIIKIVKTRSSYGLNTFSVACQLVYRFLVALNVVCLQPTDFNGLVQFHHIKVLPRLMTFLINTEVWYIWLPVVFLLNIFEESGPEGKKGFNYNLFVQFFLPIFHFFIFTLFLILGSTSGFTGGPVILMGRVLSSINGFLVFLQYLPQIYTTCKIKKSGSLSVLTIGLQAPGSFLDVVFFAFGQGNDFSIWAPILLTATLQTILTVMCIYYDYKDKKRKQFQDDNKIEDALLENGDIYIEHDIQNAVNTVEDI